jgi:hypothetical protein
MRPCGCAEQVVVLREHGNNPAVFDKCPLFALVRQVLKIFSQTIFFEDKNSALIQITEPFFV